MTFYPIRREPVKPVRVWYLCKVLGCSGTLRPLGMGTTIGYDTNWQHACDKCAAYLCLPAMSGQIEYETDEDRA